MMQKKLFIGLFSAAVVGIGAGEYLFNRSGAQDAPKKVDSEKKGDLFDILKKDLEAKKDGAPTFPALPVQPPVAQPPPKDDKAKEPVFPPLDNDRPPVLPALQQGGASAQAIPPPTVSLPQAPTPPPLVIPALPSANLPVPQPTVSQQPPAPTKPAPLVINEQKNEPPITPPTVEPAVLEPKKALPIPVNNVPFPPLNPAKADVTLPVPVDNVQFPPLNPAKPGVKHKPAVGSPPFDPTKSSNLPIAEQVANLKDCPWSLRVEMVDGQTVVTATVNKKHEFRIVCQSLDLQTGRGVLKATGKVEIHGDAVNATCEHLAIPLMEDRLVLEGGVEVRIQKMPTNVSSRKPEAFELKGETLNLRISELPSGKFLQTSMRKTTVDSNVKQAVLTTIADKRWTPYGKLVRHESKAGPYWWRLEGRAGETIAYLLAREGGTLAQHAGRTLSVFGTREGEDGGYPVLRVTHIALP